MTTALFDASAYSADELADSLSTRELALLSGATFRQVDYWARTGRLLPLVEATGHGSRRRWARGDVDRARALLIVGILHKPARRGLLLDVIGGSAPPWSVVFDHVRITITPVGV